MVRTFRRSIAALLISCLVIWFYYSNVTASVGENPALIQSITVTNGSVVVNFDSNVSGLSANDLVLTATLDGTIITLDNLQFDTSTNTYTFTPIAQSIVAKYLVIEVDACSTKIAGGLSQGLTIPAILQNINMDNGYLQLVYNVDTQKLSEDEIVITAKIDNSLVSLDNLFFDYSTDTFTFTPIPQTAREQYFEITVSSTSVSGSLSAGLYIPAHLEGKVETPHASPPSGSSVNYGSSILLSDNTPDAQILYRISTDITGRTYTYDSNIPPVITADATITAWAVKEGMNISDTAEFTYTLQDKVNIPAASPNGGLIDGGSQVTLTCPTPDAKIFYTLDGTTPTPGGSLYTGPIVINTAVTLMAIAVKDGMTDSNIAIYSFTIRQKAPAPYISPASGVVAYGTQIIIGRSSVYEPRVMYTTDGSEPTSSHGSMCLPWDSPKIIGTVKGDMTIKAITVKSNMTISDVTTRTYICKAAAPTASLASGIVLPKSIVTLSSIVPDSTIYFTTNGSDPSDVNSHSRKIYTEDTNLIINRQITIKAVTVKAGMPDSDIATFTYDVKHHCNTCL